MNPESNTTQADLLDRYLDALRRNPNAPVPDGLDANTAAFAQVMVADEADQGIPPGDWATLLHRATTPPKGAGLPDELNEIQQEYPHMTTYTPDITETKLTNRLPFTLFAATLAVAAFALLLFGGFGGGPSNNPFAAFIQNETATPTPLPTATFTPTPAPMGPTALPPTVAPAASGGGGGGNGPVAPQGDFGLTIDDIFGAISPEEIEMGTVYTRQMDLYSPYATFTYTAPADMALVTIVETERHSATYREEIQSAPSDSIFGGGGGGGGGGPLNGPQVTVLTEGDTLRVAIGVFPQVTDVSVEFRIRFLEVDAVPIGDNATVTGTITQELPFGAYQFEADPGMIYTIRAEGRNENALDTMLMLRALERSVMLFGQDSDSGLGLNPELYEIMTFNRGDAIIFVLPEYTGDTGDYSMQLNNEPVPDVSDVPAAVRLTGMRPNRIVQATGTPGEVGTVEITAVDGNVSVDVAVGDGERVIASSSGQDASLISREFTFPESGLVYIRVQNSTASRPISGAQDIEVVVR